MDSDEAILIQGSDSKVSYAENVLNNFNIIKIVIKTSVDSLSFCLLGYVVCNN